MLGTDLARGGFTLPVVPPLFLTFLHLCLRAIPLLLVDSRQIQVFHLLDPEAAARCTTLRARMLRLHTQIAGGRFLLIVFAVWALIALKMTAAEGLRLDTGISFFPLWHIMRNVHTRGFRVMSLHFVPIIKHLDGLVLRAEASPLDPLALRRAPQAAEPYL